MMKKRTIPTLSRLVHILISTGTLVLLLAGTFMLAQAAPPSQDAGNGEAVFKAKCAGCHSIGGGKLVGPDLKGITLLRDSAWLAKWIKSPNEVLASGDPIAVALLAEYNNLPMPDLGLSDTEVAELIAYFKKMDGVTSPTATQLSSTPSDQLIEPTTPSANPPLSEIAMVLALNGNPDYGQKLFTGEIPLGNGGTACIACLSVEGVGFFGGCGLGPDQTHVYTRYGREGLTSVLVTLPFPTMQSIYTNRLLTIEDQADLLAFFARADKLGQPRTQFNLLTTLGAGSGLAVILLAGMLIFWPRQRLSLSQRLRKNGKL